MTRRERNSFALHLDKLVPLSGASHCEVIDYTVNIPTRYAVVQARLASGKTARLANGRQFLGWTGYGSNPTLLFNCGDRNIVLYTGSNRSEPPKRFITRDGSLISSGATA
jgi:hypothetical protein